MPTAAVPCGGVSAFDPDDLNRVVVTLVRLAVVACGVLAVTGLVLTVAYDPDGTGWLSGLHSLASALLLGCAVGVVACAAGSALKRSRTWPGWPLTLAGLAVAGAGVVSGQILRWTGVVPDDPDARGLFGPLGGAVDAVVVGDAELSQGAFTAWVVGHVVVVTALVVAVGVAVRRRRARWAAGVAADAGAEPSTGDGAPADAGPAAPPP